jgi:hypothetical protein
MWYIDFPCLTTRYVTNVSINETSSPWRVAYFMIRKLMPKRTVTVAWITQVGLLGLGTVKCSVR